MSIEFVSSLTFSNNRILLLFTLHLPMQFQIPIKIDAIKPSITYQDKVLLMGSCFTEHIGSSLAEAKFNILQNPNGILFDTLSVCRAITAYIENIQYDTSDLFMLNEAWHSWEHHSRFSSPDKATCLENINLSQTRAHQYLKQCNWLIITLGSSFSYKLVESNRYVSNCHKAPAQSFEKHLNSIEESVSAFDNMLYRLFKFNPNINVLFTVSPVRHIRDGIIDNNRSKARLLETVHHLVNKFSRLYYFPSYELVVDVLRDYRFYDIDLVHPNYAATQYVLEKFVETLMDADTQLLMETLRKLMIAKKHKAFNPDSNQHKAFLDKHYQLSLALSKKYSYINFEEELNYFANKQI